MPAAKSAAAPGQGGQGGSAGRSKEDGDVGPFRLRALGSENLAVVLLPESSGSAAEALDWLATALPAARTSGGADGGIAALAGGGAAGASAVVVPESALRAVPPPPGASVDGHWVAFEIASPASASARRPMPTAAALAAVGSVLGAAGIRWRALPAAEAASLVLVHQEDLYAATVALARNGHAVGPPARVCPPVPAEDPTASERNSQYVGVWSLLRREETVGETVEEHPAGQGPLRLQAPSGIFAEIRIPARCDDALTQASCGGYHAVVDASGGKRLSVRHRTIDFRPPSGCVLCTQVKFDREVMGELSHPRGRVRDEYIEAWTRVDSGPVTALELIAEIAPAGLPAPQRRAGYWLFAGERFARVIGPPRGEGVVAGACCGSSAQLEVLCGAQVRTELQSLYEASWGRLEGAGRLRIGAEAWAPSRAGQLLYDSASGVGGRISFLQNEVVHLLPSGVEQRWRVRDWGFDPFGLAQEARGAAASSASSAASSRPSSRSASPEELAEAPEVVPAALVAAALSPVRAASASERASSRSSRSASGSPRSRSRPRKKKDKRKKADAEDRDRSRGRRRKHHRRRRRRRSASAHREQAQQRAAPPSAYPPGHYPPQAYPSPYAAPGPDGVLPPRRPPGPEAQPPPLGVPGHPPPPHGYPPHGHYGHPPPGHYAGYHHAPPPGYPVHGPYGHPPPGVCGFRPPSVGGPFGPYMAMAPPGRPGAPPLGPPMAPLGRPGMPPMRPMHALPTDPVSAFLAENKVDEKAAHSLRALPPELQHRVVAEGNVLKSNNPSAVLMGRIRVVEVEERGGRRGSAPLALTDGRTEAPGGPDPAGLAFGAKLLVRAPGPPQGRQAPEAAQSAVKAEPSDGAEKSAAETKPEATAGGALGSGWGDPVPRREGGGENGDDDAAAKSAAAPASGDAPNLGSGWGDPVPKREEAPPQMVPPAGPPPAMVPPTGPPPPGPPPLGPPPAWPADGRVPWFCSTYGIDAGAERVLRQLHPELQRRLLDEGPVGGPNPSLELMSRIHRAESWEHGRATQVFFAGRHVDGHADSTFRNLPMELQRAIMTRGPLMSPDASGELHARIREAAGGRGAPPEVRSSYGDAVGHFVRENNIDSSAGASLRSLTTEQQRNVMEEGSLDGTKNPSAVLMSRIKRAKDGREARSPSPRPRSRSRDAPTRVQPPYDGDAAGGAGLGPKVIPPRDFGA